MKTIALAVSLLATVGCSTLPHGTISRAGRDQSERHGTTAVHAGRAKALVSGPALIRHLETEGDGAVGLYLADDPGIADRACPSAARGRRIGGRRPRRPEPAHEPDRAGREANVRHDRVTRDAGGVARADRRRAGGFHRRRAALALRRAGTPDGTRSYIDWVAPEAGRKGDDRRLAIALLAGAPGAAEARVDDVLAERPARPAALPGLGSGRTGSVAGSLRPSVHAHPRASRSGARCARSSVTICLGVAQNELRRRCVRQRLGLTDTGELARASDWRRGLRGAPGARPLSPAARRPR